MDQVTIAKRRTPITWILVADGRRAHVHMRSPVRRLIPLHGGGAKHPHYAERYARELVPIADMVWEVEPMEHCEIGRNATGMVFESVGGARHLAAPHYDMREEIRRRFAQDVARHINAARAEHRFERLVLIAPPRMLGDLRAHLDKGTLDSVVAEVPKELARRDERTVLEHLEETNA
jgi:protein required for attachment to host cells